MAKSNILSQYTNADGVLVTVFKPRRPRQSEKTWITGAKWSVANLGRKAIGLRDAGLVHAKG
jgi:hypothetical protein